MSSSSLSVLSGIGAAVAGLAGEKVSKSGEIPGFDLAAILPALLGNSGGIAGSIVSAVAKSGILKNVNVAELAGTLLSMGKTASSAPVKKNKAGTVAELASAILSGSGKAADLGSIASLAASLAGSVKDKKGLTGIATQLGGALNSSGVNISAGSTTLKALDSVMGKDIKTDLFKAVLKGLV